MESGLGKCLSLRQNGTLKAKDKPEGFITPAMVVRWPGASEVRVTRELITKVCFICHEKFDIEKAKDDRSNVCPMCKVTVRECVHCGSKFSASMRTLRTEHEIICPDCGGINPGIARRDIVGFSAKSRLALMREMNKLKKDALNVNFVTLTFDDGFLSRDEGIEQAKGYLRAFELRFRRAFSNACYFWKMEVVDRKSGLFPGRLAPHFHLLTFSVTTGVLRQFIAQNWPDIIGGTPESLKVNAHEKVCTPVVSRKMIMGYASKGIGSLVSAELAKDIQTGSGLGAPGRWWGKVGGDKFDALQAVEQPEELNDSDTISLFRFFRSYMRGQRVNRYMKACENAKKAKKALPREPGERKTFQVRSMTAFIDSDVFWDKLHVLLGGSGSWCFVCSGREYSKLFWLALAKPDSRIDWLECGRQAEETRVKSITRQERGMMKQTGRLAPGMENSYE